LRINSDFSRKAQHHFCSKSGAGLCPHLCGKITAGSRFCCQKFFAFLRLEFLDKALDSLSSGERKGKSPNSPCPSDKEIRSMKSEFRNNDQNSNVQNALPHLYPPPPPNFVQEGCYLKFLSFLLCKRYKYIRDTLDKIRGRGRSKEGVGYSF